MKAEKIKIIYKQILELNGIYHEMAKRSGISDSELHVLSTLVSVDDPLSQQDLSDILSLPKQTINSLIKRYVQEGYVELIHEPGSKNRKVLILTDTGSEYAREKIAWINRAEQAAISTLQFDQLQTVIDVLEDYIKGFQSELKQ